jgi:hypothetical protein
MRLELVRRTVEEGPAAPSGSGLRQVFVLPGQAGEEFGPALAFFGGQVRHSRRILLPVGIGVDLRITRDSGIDADWCAGHHGEIERVTRTGIDLDDPALGLPSRT